MFTLAKEKRKNPTEAEGLLWQHLKNKQLGRKFRRQHVIGNFIVDFVDLSSGLIIEVDGGYHTLPEQKILDDERSKILNNKGYRILRFTNEEVIADINNVISKIKSSLQ